MSPGGFLSLSEGVLDKNSHQVCHPEAALGLQLIPELAGKRKKIKRNCRKPLNRGILNWVRKLIFPIMVSRWGSQRTPEMNNSAKAFVLLILDSRRRGIWLGNDGNIWEPLTWTPSIHYFIHYVHNHSSTSIVKSVNTIFPSATTQIYCIGQLRIQGKVGVCV